MMWIFCLFMGHRWHPTVPLRKIMRLRLVSWPEKCYRCGKQRGI